MKTAVIGASYVGKSTLCYAIDHRPVYGDYTSTIGVDYILKRVHKDIYIGLWDLAGLEKFSTIVSHYVKSSKQAIFCYSSESYQSYLDMIYKYEYYKRCKCLEDKPIFVVATKIDSKKADMNYKKWSQEFVYHNNLQFIATSSYSRQGLEELTNALVDKKKLILLDQDETDPLIPLLLAETKPISRRSFKCCM